MRMRGVGIVWEEWRCTRNVLMGAFAFQALMIAFAAWRASHGMSAKGFVFLAYSVVPALIFILLFAQGDPRNVRLAFPKRRFLLPVSTSTLVLWPLVYRVLVVVAAVSLAVGASWAGYGSRAGALVHDAFQNLCIVLVAYAAIQTLAWVSPLFHGPVAALFGIVVAGPALSYFYLNYDKIPIASPLREFFLIAASFALACVVSIWTTQRLRWRGKTAPIGATLGAGRTRTTRFSMDAFRSPLIAQTWFEWRRFDSGSTLIVSIGILAAMGLVCSGMYLESNAAAPPNMRSLWASGIAVSGSCAAIARIWKNIRLSQSARRGHGMFLRLRPMSTRDMAHATLCSAFVSVAVWTLVLVGMLGAFQYVCSRSGVSAEMVYIPATMGGAIAIVLGVFAVNWLAYWEGGRFMLIWWISQMVLLADRERSLAFYQYAFAEEPSARTTTLVALVLLAPVCAFAIVRAFRARLLGSNGVVSLMTLWIASSLIATVALNAYPLTATSTVSGNILMASAACLIVLSPLATATTKAARLRQQ